MAYTIFYAVAFSCILSGIIVVSLFLRRLVLKISNPRPVFTIMNILAWAFLVTIAIITRFFPSDRFDQITDTYFDHPNLSYLILIAFFLVNVSVFPFSTKRISVLQGIFRLLLWGGVIAAICLGIYAIKEHVVQTGLIYFLLLFSCSFYMDLKSIEFYTRLGKMSIFTLFLSLIVCLIYLEFGHF